MLWTYILQNVRGGLYIGYTSDFNIRLAWHNSGKSKFTKNKGPWSYIYLEPFKTKSEAIKHEKYLKSLKNSQYIKKLIK